MVKFARVLVTYVKHLWLSEAAVVAASARGGVGGGGSKTSWLYIEAAGIYCRLRVRASTTKSIIVHCVLYYST